MVTPDRPWLSFVVPAHNEARWIGATLDAMERACAGESWAYERIVADDASTDETAAIAERAGARVVATDRRQISAARNAGAKEARGDVLCFVDADTLVTAEVMRAVRAAVDAGAIGGGCLVDFDGRLPLYARMMIPGASFAQRCARFAAGCFLFATREAFDAVGGFDEEMFGAEEIEMSKRLKRHGKFVVVRERVTTSGRKMRAHSGWTILRTMASLAVRGRRGVRTRERLALWYDAGDRDA